MPDFVEKAAMNDKVVPKDEDDEETSREDDLEEPGTAAMIDN